MHLLPHAINYSCLKKHSLQYLRIFPHYWISQIGGLVYQFSLLRYIYF